MWRNGGTRGSSLLTLADDATATGSVSSLQPVPWGEITLGTWGNMLLHPKFVWSKQNNKIMLNDCLAYSSGIHKDDGKEDLN
uniref:Uncharacterized protein n=1 Tax=Anguilla anguilla TaxID=7936 RepID=A0A0E9V4H4_ANGAN